MKAITERLDWIELYLRTSAPTDGDPLAKEAAWTTCQELRAIGEALPELASGGAVSPATYVTPGHVPGCVCPPTSEKTCQAPNCARRGRLPAAMRPDPIIRLPNG